MSPAFKPRTQFSPRSQPVDRPVPPAPVPKTPALIRSPITWGSIAGAGVIAAITLPGILAQPIVFIQANDTSASAEKLAPLRQELCQAASQTLKSGDAVIWMSFADRPEVTRDQTLTHSLSLLGQCQKSIPTHQGKAPGTSLMLATDRAQQQVTLHRSQGQGQPIAVVMTLDEAEPGPGQPALDWAHLKAQFQKITRDRGAVAIIGPTGQLQSDLETQLQGIPRLRVCPAASAKACLEETIAAARKL